MPFALMTHEWHQLGLDPLSVSWPQWIRRQAETVHWILCAVSPSKRKMAIWFCISLLFYISTAHPKHCKNIYYMTKLDILFCTVWCNSFILPWTSRSTRPTCTLFLHMNELVNIQMTPQKNWHLERIEYKHLYSFSSCSRLNISL